MKTIKLFNIFGVDANRLRNVRDQIMDFFLGSGKWTYDEIHIPCNFANDKDINELIKEYNLNDKVSYYDPSEKTMHELPKSSLAFYDGSDMADRIRAMQQTQPDEVYFGKYNKIGDIPEIAERLKGLTQRKGMYSSLLMRGDMALRDSYIGIIKGGVFKYNGDKFALCHALNNTRVDYRYFMVPRHLKTDNDIINTLLYNPNLQKIVWTDDEVAKSDSAVDSIIDGYLDVVLKRLKGSKSPNVEGYNMMYENTDKYMAKNSSNLIGDSPSLKDVHNRMILNRLMEQTKEIVEKNSKSPKLEVTHVGTNEDGALRVVIDVKEQNDPNTFLKVIRGLNKVLREYEEDILNG